MTSTGRPTATRAQTACDCITVAAFAAALAAPTVDHYLRSDAQRGPGPELRVAAPRPRYPHTADDFLAYPARYEAYWKDTFGLRDVLLRWHSALMVFVFGVSPDRTHVLGRDNWIFNDNSDIIDNWRGVIPFDERALRAWQQRIERRRDAVRALGAHYLFSIAPDKPQIYPEFLPPRFNKVGPSRLDQLCAWMLAHSDADVFDVRPALLVARAGDTPTDHVYFPLGTHWEKRGAIVGFNAMVDHLRPLFPALRNLPLTAHDLQFRPELGDSEGRNMYIGDLLPQASHWLNLRRSSYRAVAKDDGHRVTFQTDDPGKPRVVMFHDSFGSVFQDQWAESCSQLTMVHSYDFDLGVVAEERPNLVIEFVVERCLVFQDPASLTPGELPRAK